MGICHRVRQLFVGMELEELIEIFRLFVAFAQELGILLEPCMVFLLESFVFRAAEECVLVLFVEGFEEDHLRVIHVLVIREGFCVKLRFLRLIFLLHCRRQTSHSLDIDIYRMERKDRNGVVRITVAVVMTECSIVDRQCLNHLLTRSSRPFRQQFEILEFTDTESRFATEREDRNSHAGSFPSGLRAAETAVVLINHLTFLDSPYLAVLAPLGIYHSTGLEVINDIFVFYDILPFDLDVRFPEGELGVTHDEFVIRVPVAQCLAIADDCHSLRGEYLRQVD